MKRLRLISMVLPLAGCAGSWKSDPHLVMNHRTTRVFAPQETVPAIRYAVRAGAAWVCGRHRIVEAADRLRELLANEDENVRLDAALALGRLRR